MKESLTRRYLLGSGGTVAAALVAGCSGVGGGNPTDDEDAEADEPDPDLRVGDRYLSSAFPIEFVDPGFDAQTGFADDARITYVHWHGTENSHWHQSPLELDAGESLAGRTRFLLEGAEEIPLDSDSAYSQRAVSTEETPDELMTTTVDGGRVEIVGEEAGTGEMRFELYSEGEALWVSPPLPVEIV